MSKHTTAPEEPTDESPKRPVITGADAVITAPEADGVGNITTASEQDAARVNDRVHISGDLGREQ